MEGSDGFVDVSKTKESAIWKYFYNKSEGLAKCILW